MESVATITKQGATRWGAERRIEFIDFRLLWDGTVNRGELVNFFGISTQQASADLAKYIELAPDNLEYDRNQKTYRVRAGFRPVMTRPDAHAYLNQLAGLANSTIAASATFLGWVPPHDLVRYPTRSIPTETLIRVMWAIRGHEEVQVQYQSMRRPAPTIRWIAPHAIAFDGLRWHARAWCAENQEFRDFVLSRIQSVHASRTTTVGPQDDDWWNTTVNIDIQPREELTAAQRRAIEADYGMENGRLRVPQRKALAFYFLRQLQLDLPNPSPVVQPLRLANPEALADVLAAAQKTPDATHTYHTEKLHE